MFHTFLIQILKDFSLNKTIAFHSMVDFSTIFTSYTDMKKFNVRNGEKWHNQSTQTQTMTIKDLKECKQIYYEKIRIHK